MLVLGSGHAYGVMLNDDVTVADDFERTLEAHLLRFSEPMKFATYRLGPVSYTHLTLPTICSV